MMVTLALDTSTRAGSVAVSRNGELLGWESGDPRHTHGERLPGELLDILRQSGLTLSDVNLFAVCSGPGSFTGLRVGLATVQGLALSGGQPVVPIPTLEALAHTGLQRVNEVTNQPEFIVPWMNAQRDEVFAAIYETGAGGELVPRYEAAVGRADELLSRWGEILAQTKTLFIGDAVASTRSAIEAVVAQRGHLMDEMPALAPVAAHLAQKAGSAGWRRAHAVRPVYVRRPDAELARDRRRGETST